MAAPTISVTTPHGTFLRSTWHDYQVIAVGLWPDGTTIGTTWHASLANALKAPHWGFATILGYYSVTDGSLVAPGRTPQAGGRRAPKAVKPVVVHEFERCAECDRRHGPERLRCGNCWRCHEPTTKCGTTKKEVQASIERHAAQPDFYRVLTNTWRPWDQLMVPQCDCHGTPS